MILLNLLKKIDLIKIFDYINWNKGIYLLDLTYN